MFHLGHIMMLGMTVAGKRRVSEIGWVVGGLGAIFLIVQGYMLSRKPNDRENRGVVTMVAGLLIGVAFLFQLISLHY